MAHVLQVIGLANGQPSDADGLYVKSYTPDGHEGRGDLVLTEDLSEAQRFDSPADALDLWKRQAAPPFDTRADGRPNRPMTAFSVTAIKLDAPRAASEPPAPADDPSQSSTDRTEG